jgi:hypothetical protein
MRKLLALLVVAGALVAAGTALSFGSPTDPFPGGHIYGGGEFGPGCFSNGVCFSAPREFGLDVHGDGRNLALGTLEFGVPRVSSMIVRITCARVEGNQAVVGGWITHATNPAAVGMAAAMYFVDNGPPGSPSPDEASSLWVGQPGVPTDFPATFPAVCLPARGTDNAPALFQDVHGDVAVKGM